MWESSKFRIENYKLESWDSTSFSRNNNILVCPIVWVFLEMISAGNCWDEQESTTTYLGMDSFWDLECFDDVNDKSSSIPFGM